MSKSEAKIEASYGVTPSKLIYVHKILTISNTALETAAAVLTTKRKAFRSFNFIFIFQKRCC